MDREPVIGAGVLTQRPVSTPRARSSDLNELDFELKPEPSSHQWMELNESRDWQCKQRTHKWTDRRKRLNRQKCAADVDGWAVQSDQPAAVTWPLPPLSNLSNRRHFNLNVIQLQLNVIQRPIGADWSGRSRDRRLIGRIFSLRAHKQQKNKRGAQLSGRPIAGLKDHRPWPRSAPVSRSGRCRNYGIPLRVMRFRRTLTLTNGRFYLNFSNWKKRANMLMRLNEWNRTATAWRPAGSVSRRRLTDCASKRPPSTTRAPTPARASTDSAPSRSPSTSSSSVRQSKNRKNSKNRKRAASVKMNSHVALTALCAFSQFASSGHLAAATCLRLDFHPQPAHPLWFNSIWF